MEVEGSDGSKTRLKPNSTTVFGRANQFNSKDLSISRRHISFDIISSPNSPNTQTIPRVSFEVLGKNPIWVYFKNNGDKKVTSFKRFQRGELGVDDFFCISSKTPVWFTLKKVEDDDFDDRKGKSLELEGRINADLSQSLEINDGFDDFQMDTVDVSNIDPVQEFGFLVIGHEFDHYPKKMIRHIKNWDWFLEDPVGNSDDEESHETNERPGKKGGKRKRKNTSGDNDADEEWTAESEVEELTTQANKAQRAKYHTRSKDSGLSGNKKTSRKTSTSTSSRREEEESEDEGDVEDETLGGFIVDDEIAEEEDEENEMDEEEFVEDEDELED